MLEKRSARAGETAEWICKKMFMSEALRPRFDPQHHHKPELRKKVSYTSLDLTISETMVVEYLGMASGVEEAFKVSGGK